MTTDWGKVVNQGTDQFRTSTWQEGADAARRGQLPAACPYRPEQYDFVTWMNGWTNARYYMAREEWDL